MIEDKLSREQRVRLEALSQAVILRHIADNNEILDTAKQFENYLITGDEHK